jgi:hypothetical protein
MYDQCTIPKENECILASIFSFPLYQDRQFVDVLFLSIFIFPNFVVGVC